MSRLYGRSDDVYNISKYLLEKDLQEYNYDKTKITFEEIQDTLSCIEIYLPEKAIEIITNTPIVLSKTILVKKPLTFLPNDKEKEPVIYLPKRNIIKEYQNDVIFFTGRFLASFSPDKMPTDFTIPCEFHDVIPFLLNYLYHRENNNEDIFSLKYLHELSSNAESFVKIYDKYQEFLDARFEGRIFGSNERIEKYYESNMKAILYKTLKSLVPLSSMDATLQIIDRNYDSEEYKNLLNELIVNQNNNREEILRNKGIESFGFKRLAKEIDKKRKR